MHEMLEALACRVKPAHWLKPPSDMLREWAIDTAVRRNTSTITRRMFYSHEARTDLPIFTAILMRDIRAEFRRIMAAA